MKLYFVRHGESEANLLHEFSNRGLKHPLTGKGRQQAHTLAAAFRGMPLARLFSSPILRAIQTAEILAEAVGVPYEITDALREYDCGIWEESSDPAGWKIYDQVVEAWQRGEYEQRMEGGESFLDIQARFVPFIEGLVSDYGRSATNLVLVGHGGTYRMMLPRVLTNVDPRFALDNHLGNTSAVVAELRPEGLCCLAWGEIALG
ncbi:MAG TPA: histidine phosphatase family protein [Aggregatilineales bacterium]|nr:histidine phosphatase family protein [Aggregatilineales bacterium]